MYAHIALVAMLVGGIGPPERITCPESTQWQIVYTDAFGETTGFPTSGDPREVCEPLLPGEE